MTRFVAMDGIKPAYGYFGQENMSMPPIDAIKLPITRHACRVVAIRAGR